MIIECNSTGRYFWSLPPYNISTQSFNWITIGWWLFAICPAIVVSQNGAAVEQPSGQARTNDQVGFLRNYDLGRNPSHCFHRRLNARWPRGCAGWSSAIASYARERISFYFHEWKLVLAKQCEKHQFLQLTKFHSFYSQVIHRTVHW